MNIKFFIDDDYKLSSETVDIQIKGDTFDIPKNISKLKNLCLAIAVLRGHPKTSGIKNIIAERS